jgi:hypothetical protein
MFKGTEHRFAARLHDFTRDANHRCAFGDRVDDYGSGSYFGVVAKLDIPENRRTGTYHNTITKRRVAFAALVAGTTQCDALVEQHIIADFSGFANHYP